MFRVTSKIPLKLVYFSKVDLKAKPSAPSAGFLYLEHVIEFEPKQRIAIIVLGESLGKKRRSREEVLKNFMNSSSGI